MFTYGTLVNDDMRFNVLGHDTTSIPANLINYEVVTHSYANYPTIKFKMGSITDGILFNVCLSDLVKLDKYENNLYNRISVIVNNTQCYAYIEKIKINIKCSLCSQEFNKNDPDIEIRKSRHELGMHSLDRIIYSERDGSASKPMGNHIYGNVMWLDIKE